MTVNEYLNDVFLYNGSEGDLEFYKVSVQGKGEVIAEYNKSDESVNLIHTDRSGRYFNYLVTDAKELRETVEYCLGPIVTDAQWRKATIDDTILDDGDDWDIVD